MVKKRGRINREKALVIGSGVKTCLWDLTPTTYISILAAEV